MEKLQLVSIVIELVIGVVAVITAVKGRKYMFGLAFTFLVYVFYDLSHIYSFGVTDSFLSVLFFLSTLSALWSVWNIYKHYNQ